MRKEKILQHVRRDGIGIEVGPSHNPIAPKREGFRVHVIDHASREELIAKYADHGVHLDNIEEVDFVWKGQSYAELTGQHHFYDWIISSHTIEHSPDLIGFLNDCSRVLKDDGVLTLAIPDKRYCFDCFRPITGLARVIDAHVAKASIHSAGSVAEYFLNVVSNDEQISWHPSSVGNHYRWVHTVQNAVDGMRAVNVERAYLDVHAWCFVPHSFRLLIHDLFSLGLIDFQEVDFSTDGGTEFYMVLSRQGRGVSMSRLALMAAIAAEEAVAGVPGTVSGKPSELVSAPDSAATSAEHGADPESNAFSVSRLKKVWGWKGRRPPG
ncbi:MAG: class I SAM-dependent methyltransferase [Pseudomonadota bacterium]